MCVCAVSRVASLHTVEPELLAAVLCNSSRAAVLTLIFASAMGKLEGQQYNCTIVSIVQ